MPDAQKESVPQVVRSSELCFHIPPEGASRRHSPLRIANTTRVLFQN